MSILPVFTCVNIHCFFSGRKSINDIFHHFLQYWISFGWRFNLLRGYCNSMLFSNSVPSTENNSIYFLRYSLDPCAPPPLIHSFTYSDRPTDRLSTLLPGLLLTQQTNTTSAIGPGFQRTPEHLPQGPDELRMKFQYSVVGVYLGRKQKKSPGVQIISR